MPIMLKKILLIKLGNSCNLSCPHCHRSNCEFAYNPEIIDFIKGFHPDEIVFSGGEPLLYIDFIMVIVSALDDLNISYRLVTNGTLLSEDSIEFFKSYDFFISMSYDGERGFHEGSPDYGLLRNFKKNGLAVTVYKQNLDFNLLDSDVNNLHDLFGTRDFYFPNFVHQTLNAPNFDMVDSDSVKKYVLGVAKKLELNLISFKAGVPIKQLPVLYVLSSDWFTEKTFRGVRCCSEFILNLTLSGDFLLCPYGSTVVGNIQDGINWDYVESFKPERCNDCLLWGVCKNKCIANITDNECKIFRVLHNHYLKLLAKYNLSEEDFNY